MTMTATTSSACPETGEPCTSIICRRYGCGRLYSRTYLEGQPVRRYPGDEADAE